MKLARFDFLLQPFFWWVALLGGVMVVGVAAAVQVFVYGLAVTNLTDLVPWGLWITVDLSAIALSAGAFMFSAIVYLFKLKQFQPVARTAVFVGLIGYSMALMMLLLDIGRPDRFWHGLVFWNVHSPLWEVTMCVALYFSVLLLEVLPLFGRIRWLQTRQPRLIAWLEKVHHLAPYLAIVGLALSCLHQSSLGATYGILAARPYWFQPGLAVLFMASAMAGGPAMTLLASSLAAQLTPRATLDQSLMDKLGKMLGYILLGYLYMRFWDVLASNYTHTPGRSEALALLTSGPLLVNFWVGEILLGILAPLLILLIPRLRRDIGLRTLAFLLIVGGVIAYRWDTNLAGQLVVMSRHPQVFTPLYTTYTPSPIEIMTALGVVAYGVLAFSLGVRYLRIVEHEVEAASLRRAPQSSVLIPTAS